MRDSTANEIAQLITQLLYLHCTSLINLDWYLSSGRTNSNVSTVFRICFRGTRKR